MELINNRYKVEEFLGKGSFENYIVKDSLEKNNLKCMRIIDGGKDKGLVEFYMEEFIWLTSIEHRNILNIEAFGSVETINLKNIDLPLYYLITDTVPDSRLDKIKESLSYDERIAVIQQLISTIDYLHFRGFSYKYLEPKMIFYSKAEGLKLNNLASVIEYDFIKTLDEYNEDFIAPSVLMRKDKKNVNTDYYSICMIMRYLLLDDFLEEGTFKFNETLEINHQDKVLLTDIINIFDNAYKYNVELSLLDINEKINKIVDFKFINNLKEERERLYFKTKLIGRDKELQYIDDIHTKMLNNSLDINGLVFKGSSGVGKTRLINEIDFRLKIKRNNVLRINVDQSMSYDIDIIRIFLNILTYNVDYSILERYRDSFEKYIPEKFGYQENYVNENSLQKIELYKLFNSICNYLKELALDKPLYLIVDNIGRYNETFINLIDYLLQSLFNSKVFIIVTYNEFNKKGNSSLIKKWIDEKLIKEIKLENLSKDEVIVLVQNILGMSFPPARFASVLYDSSKGNPRFLDLIIKEIYNNKELYISDKGRWFTEKDKYTDLALPTDFTKTLIKQTKYIKGDKLKVLKLISISNESLSKFIIYNMLNIDVKNLDNIINSLLNEQILVESNYDNGFYYSFLSNELKTTVYYDINDKEKKLLHKRLAELLIEYKPSSFRDLVEEISFHLIRAGMRNSAIDLIVDEASKIDNIYSAKAVALWEMAFSIVKDIEHNQNRIEIFEKLTKINLHVSNAERLEGYLSKFLSEAEKIGDLEYIIKAKNYYAELHLRNNDIEKLELVIEDICKLSSENNYIEGKILSDTLSIITLIKDSRSNRTYIKSVLDKALHQSKINNISSYLGKIYFQYGLFYDINGQHQESIKNYEKSIYYLEENGDIYETIKAINNIGNVCLERGGEKSKSFKYFKQALKKANEYGFTHLESIILHNIGETYLNILDYKKALEYTEKSIMLAQTNKDLSIIIVSNCNLGRLYLSTNQYNKAYEIYTFIKSVYIEELIADSEIVIAYRNFLGEFYFNFGRYELATRYTKLVKDMTLGFSENYYFKSIFRLINIDYLTGNIDKDKVFKLLSEYDRLDTNEAFSSNIFELVFISINKEDFNFGMELMQYYIDSPKVDEPDVLSDTYTILSLFLNRKEEDLVFLEKKINEIENKYYHIDTRLYIQLSKLYKEFNNHKKSMFYNIKSFDGIYKSVDSIKEFEIKLSFIKSLDVQVVKDNIASILLMHYGMNIRSIRFEEINDDNFNEYFDLTPVIDSLTKKEINDIVSYRDDVGIDSINELLSKLDDDYVNNIRLVLKYIGKETLAQRGIVLKYNDDRVSLEPLVSLVDSDSFQPNEIILLQSLRQKNGFLFNFTFQGFSQNRHSAFIPKNARGIICIPITSKISSDAKEKDIHGYIYLETDNALNRFDLERRKLVNSLSKLISLNMENEDLRVNSTTDKNTGVYNREYFEYRFKLMLEEYRNKPGGLSVFMIDIDRFKVFNDKYGHLKGDEVLSQVATTIKSTIGSNGIVGRYGGEEFIVLLWECDLEQAKKLGNAIRENVEKSHIPRIEDNITVSIGLAQYPIHGSYQMELINNADQALYHAKEILNRNILVVWDKNIKVHTKSIDKTKGLVTSNPSDSNRNILQMIDISETIKSNKNIEDKIYQLLGTIITISNCEYATLIEFNGYDSNSYTRKRQIAELIENKHINLSLVQEVKGSKKGISTIGWQDDLEDNFDLPDWDSILVVPLIKEETVKAILYITVPLMEREFNQDTLNVMNLFSNIFSGNY